MSKESCFKCGKANDGSNPSYCKSCYNAYKRDWFQRNKQSEYERSKAYRLRRPEVYRDSMRKRRAANPVADYEYRKRWAANNKDKVAAHDATKRGRRKIRIGESKVTAAEWRAIVIAHNGACAYCGSVEKMTIDHVVPIAKGGAHSKENIVPACHSCNSRKQAMDADEFREKIRNERIQHTETDTADLLKRRVQAVPKQRRDGMGRERSSAQGGKADPGHADAG